MATVNKPTNTFEKEKTMILTTFIFIIFCCLGILIGINLLDGVTINLLLLLFQGIVLMFVFTID